MSVIRLLALLACLAIGWHQTIAPPAVAQEEEAEPPEPVTTGDPEIPTAQLEFLVTPLTLADLEVEAQAWQDLLKAKAVEVSEVEVAVAEMSAAEAAAAEVEGEQAAEGGDQAEEVVSEEKQALLDEATALRDERTALIDRLNVVLDEMEAKGGERFDVEAIKKAA